MGRVRRWAKAFLVAGVAYASATPAMASCDERIQGSCPGAPIIESAPASEPVTVDRAPASRTRASTQRSSKRGSQPSSARRQTGRTQARFEDYQEEDVAIPMPPVRPRSMTAAAPVSPPASSFVPMPPWHPSEATSVMAFESPTHTASATPIAPREAGEREPSAAPPYSGRPTSRATPSVPSSPVAQERASTPPPPAAPPPVRTAAAASANPAPTQTAAAAAATAPDAGDTSMLRTFFIGLAGLLAVGTVLRLALG